MNHYKLKQNIKYGLSLLLFYSGITQYLLKKKTANKCIVLMYHRIMPKAMIPECPSHKSIVMSLEIFKKQMGYLAKRFNLISVDEMAFHLEQQKPFPKNSLVITFDDGWKDNFDYAFHVLKSYNIPAMVFLSTGYIGTQRKFWQERLTSLLLKEMSTDNIKQKKMNALFKDLNLDPKLLSDNNKQRLVSILIQKIKAYEYDEIKKILEKVETLSGQTDNKQNRNIDKQDFVSWNDIDKMIKEGIFFGSHGVNHLILTKKNVNINFELQKSRSDMQQKGISVNAISYPNGNYNGDILQMTKNAGYKIGFGTEFGYNHHESNPYTLKRINVNENASSNIPMLLGRILGMW